MPWPPHVDESKKLHLVVDIEAIFLWFTDCRIVVTQNLGNMNGSLHEGRMLPLEVALIKTEDTKGRIRK